MTIKQKIDSIDVDKLKNPAQIREYIKKIEKVAEQDSLKAETVLDGLIAKISLSNPDAIRGNSKITASHAKKSLSRLKKLKSIVPKKVDEDKIREQIKKAHPEYDDAKVEQLLKTRLQAQLDRDENIQKMIDNLPKFEVYSSKDLSPDDIDYVAPKHPREIRKQRNLRKDAKQSAVTAGDEMRTTGKKFKRKSPTFGKRGGAKRPYYYEYRMNRRDVDEKIMLATGGVVSEQMLTQTINTLFDPNSEKGLIKFGDRKITKMNFISLLLNDKMPSSKVAKMLFSANAENGAFKTNSSSISESELVEMIDKVRMYEDSTEAPLRAERKYNGSPYNIVEYVKTDKSPAKYDISLIYNETPEIGGEHIADMKLTITEISDILGSSIANDILNESGVEFEEGEYKSKVLFLHDRQYKTGGSIPHAEKMFHLPLELAVYVPSTKDVDKVISVDEMRNRETEVKEYLAGLFGGYTSSSQLGGYVSEKDVLVNEQVFKVVSYASKEAFEKNKEALTLKISSWAKEWGQEAIGLEFEGDMYYVPQKFKVGGKLNHGKNSKVVKTYSIYELSGGQPRYFYNESEDRFIPDAANKATLYTEEQALKKRSEILKPRIENYQSSGKHYTEVHVGDLYKKGILKFKVGGKLANATYVSNRDIKGISLMFKGKLAELSGNDIVDGVYVKGNPSPKSPAKGLDAKSLLKALVKKAKEIAPDDNINNVKESQIQKLIDAGFTKDEISIIILGYATVYPVNCDNEFSGYLSGLSAYGEEYVDKYIDWVINDFQSGIYMVGLKYPDFDWSKIIKKYSIDTTPKYIEEDKGRNIYTYEVYTGKDIALGHSISYKNDKETTVTSDKIGSSIDKLTETQKDSEVTHTGFNAGYWAIVSSKKEVILDIAKMLFSQKDGYVKDVNVFVNSLGGVSETALIENNIKFAKGGVAKSYKDLFDDYKNQPEAVSDIISNYDMEIADYEELEAMKSELEGVGYTFDFDMDGTAYGLRPVGVDINQLEGFEEYKTGGVLKTLVVNPDSSHKKAAHNFLSEASTLQLKTVSRMLEGASVESLTDDMTASQARRFFDSLSNKLGLTFSVDYEDKPIEKLVDRISDTANKMFMVSDGKTKEKMPEHDLVLIKAKTSRDNDDVTFVVSKKELSKIPYTSSLEEQCKAFTDALTDSYHGTEYYYQGFIDNKDLVDKYLKGFRHSIYTIEEIPEEKRDDDDYFEFKVVKGKEYHDFMKYAEGGVLTSESPRIYVADLTAYNNGKLIGKWLDVADYKSGAEVMVEIKRLLKTWGAEEYSIHGYDNFPQELYSEYMGEAEFDALLKVYSVSKESNLPMDVVGEIYADYTPDNLSEFIAERLEGKFDSETDLAYAYVENAGGVEELTPQELETYFDYEALGQDLSISDFKDYGGYYIRTNPSKTYYRVSDKKYHSKFAKGGQIEKADASSIMKNAFHELYNKYVPLGAYESKTDEEGGSSVKYTAYWKEYLKDVLSLGHKFPTSVLDESAKNLIALTDSVCVKRFIDEYPELDGEEITYTALSNSGRTEEAEYLSEISKEYDEDIVAKTSLSLEYLEPSNPRAIDEMHTVVLRATVDMDAPEYPVGNMDDSFQITFTFNSESELKSELSESIKEVESWFDGVYYNESTTEMSI